MSLSRVVIFGNGGDAVSRLIPEAKQLDWLMSSPATATDTATETEAQAATETAASPPQLRQRVLAEDTQPDDTDESTGDSSNSSNSNKEEEATATDEDSNKENKKKKPILLLHVGPKKTATTTIQEAMLEKGWFQKALAKDGYHSERLNYQRIETLVNDCLLKGRDCDNTNLWDELMTIPYQKQHDKNDGMDNIIHSCEAFADIPHDDEITNQRFKSLSQFWDVRVVLVYRRLDEWLPSSYAESQKRKVFNRRAGRPTSNFVSGYVDTFPKFFQDKYRTDMKDPLATKQRFEAIYGASNVNVLDLDHSFTGLGIGPDFACFAIPDAPNACKAAKSFFASRGNKVLNVSNGKYMFDHDILLSAAIEKKLVKKGLVVHRLGGRHKVTLMVQEQLKKLNITDIADLPRTCISKQDEDWLLERTLGAEQLMSSKSKLSEKEADAEIQLIRNEFLANRNKKLCSIDADAVLRQEEWKSFFQNLMKIHKQQKLEKKLKKQ